MTSSLNQLMEPYIWAKPANLMITLTLWLKETPYLFFGKHFNLLGFFTQRKTFFSPQNPQILRDGSQKLIFSVKVNNYFNLLELKSDLEALFGDSENPLRISVLQLCRWDDWWGRLHWTRLQLVEMTQLLTHGFIRFICVSVLVSVSSVCDIKP